MEQNALGKSSKTIQDFSNTELEFVLREFIAMDGVTRQKTILRKI